MAIEVFNRYENKYRINEKTFFQIQNRMLDYMQTDLHNLTAFTYPICNVYYDTDNSDLIRASVQKPCYKEKLRLRSYGIPTADSEVYVEIKKKFSGLVNKRRSALKLSEAYNFLASGKIPTTQPYMNSQVLREIKYLLTRHDLKPAVYLSYERRAFFGQNDADLRISFDTKILTRRYDLRLESGICGRPLLNEGEWLMEIKISEALPLWLTRLLSEYNIYPQSFSKYGTEFKQSLTDSVLPRPSAVFVSNPIYCGNSRAVAQS